MMNATSELAPGLAREIDRHNRLWTTPGCFSTAAATFEITSFSACECTTETSSSGPLKPGPNPVASRS